MRKTVVIAMVMLLLTGSAGISGSCFASTSGSKEKEEYYKQYRHDFMEAVDMWMEDMGEFKRLCGQVVSSDKKLLLSEDLEMEILALGVEISLMKINTFDLYYVLVNNCQVADEPLLVMIRKNIIRINQVIIKIEKQTGMKTESK